jgi:exodeoxyribonuclease VII small subunit
VKGNAMTANKPTFINFEKSLQELETLVEQMEKGELSLEDSLKHFERGIELTRSCQAALRLAEQKVEQLLEKNGQIEIVPFDTQS